MSDQPSTDAMDAAVPLLRGLLDRADARERDIARATGPLHAALVRAQSEATIAIAALLIVGTTDPVGPDVVPALREIDSVLTDPAEAAAFRRAARWAVDG